MIIARMGSMVAVRGFDDCEGSGVVLRTPGFAVDGGHDVCVIVGEN